MTPCPPANEDAAGRGALGPGHAHGLPPARYWGQLLACRSESSKICCSFVMGVVFTAYRLPSMRTPSEDIAAVL